jgi:hypothetical protein
MDKYERELLKATRIAEKRIKAIYEQAILEVCLKAAGTKLKDRPFSLSLYPLLNKKIEETISKMHLDIYRELVRSIKRSWALSNKKNNEFVDKRFAKKKKNQVLYDPNIQALDAFIKRKDAGMDLSKRVWNLTDTFKKDLEQGLGVGISKGRSAASMATELKAYLNEPERLYRRVRKDGKLKLSKAAQAYHPGRGVYRSSFKNARRLTATETNMAYRNADFERWQKLPFVIGIEVKLSNNHPEFDLCDTLKGTYPKTFHFSGWHPHCRCFAVAVQISDEDYDKYEEAILNGDPLPVSKQISEVPEAFTKYVSDNRERMEGWKSKPYWLKDNKKFVTNK